MTQIFGVYAYRGYPSGATRTLKHDLCDANTFPITSDAPDLQDGYINGSYAERSRVYDNVKYYVQGEKGIVMCKVRGALLCAR
jgi:hypothetical protein